MLLLFTIFILTVLEAIHEGLAFNHKGTIAGLIEFVKLTAIALIIPVFLWTTQYDYYFTDWHHMIKFTVSMIIGWLAIRYAVFDFIHNLAAGLDLYYIGVTKLYDRVLAWIVGEKLRTPRPRFFWITRSLLLVLGVSVILYL